MNTILNIAGYKFISLSNLKVLRLLFLAQCELLHLKGTLLIAEEGINITLSGLPKEMEAFITFLQTDSRFADIVFHQTYSDTQAFKRLKVKIKKEIITFRTPAANPLNTKAPYLSPTLLKQWLDEKRDITLLDTRNLYEVNMGSFSQSTHLSLNDFSEFPQVVNRLPQDKPIVTFCTGGIRCEKAALYLLQQGYQHVYQLQGGILGYLAKTNGAHYEGDCFVFDERIALDAKLNPKDNSSAENVTHLMKIIEKTDI